MDLDARLARISGKLARAAALADPPMFGAASHRFRSGPPLPEAAVADFEKHHAVRLPTDYRAFVTRIGDGGPGRWGGAGPYHGLHPLKEWDRGLYNAADAGALARPFFDGSRAWDDDLLERGEPYDGTLALADQGCGWMSLLVVTGPHRGRIVANGGTGDEPSFCADPDFLSWYERWLDAVLAGASHFA